MCRKQQTIVELDHKLYTSHYSQRSSVSAPAKKFNEEVGR